MSDTPTPTEAEIAAQRAATEQIAALQQRDAERQRELEFLRAGVDTTTTLGGLIMVRHEGDITKESVEATADMLRSELGIVPAAPDPTDFQQAQALLHGGQVPPGTKTPEPVKSLQERVIDRYGIARRDGMSESDAIEAGISEVLAAAVQGDRTALFDPAQWAEEAAMAGHGAKLAMLPDHKAVKVVQQSR